MSNVERGLPDHQLKADLYLLGSGVLSFFDVTLLTQQILKEVKTVYHLVDLHTVERYLKTIARNSVSLNPLHYIEGRNRREIYADIARHVVEGAQRERPVALLMHGHPLVYSDISRGIYEEAEKRGLSVEAIPAVSSLDRIFINLRLDIGLKGIQIYEATSMVLRELPINVNVDCLLFQVGAFMNPLASKQRSPASEELVSLREYLLRWYPEHHRAKIVEIAVELGFESVLIDFELRDLESHASDIRYNSSLFIPAVD